MLQSSPSLKALSMPGKLYVGNLSFSVSDAQLSDLFTGANIPVESIRVVRDMDTGRSRGFAFVELPPEGDLANAIKEMNGKVLDGRPLTVTEARPQKKRDFGGPRGGGGGGFGNRGRSGGGGGGRDFNRGGGGGGGGNRPKRGRDDLY
jgi:RNA recognition motif-containing protein